MRALQHWSRTISNATSSVILDQNMRRVAIILSAPAANAYEINFMGAAVLGGGIRIPSGTAAIKLTADEFGPIIRGPVSAIADTAPVTVGVTEILDT